MSPDRPLVVKVGGGLLRDAGLAGLRRACAQATALARDRPVLVVPGGGPFADAVRDLDARVGLGDALAHDLALAAMDQLGLVLADLLGDATLAPRLDAPRGLAILDAHAALAHRDDIPRSWSVTSDSLAVLAAGVIGASDAVLLKPVAGVFARWPPGDDDAPLRTLTAAQLRARQDAGGGAAVDAYLPQAIDRTGVTVTVRHPANTTGTRITP